MDENVMRVLQMLQDGKISAQEAETLIAALRGESTSAAESKAKAEEAKPEKPFFGNIADKIKPPKIDINLEGLGDKISKAVAKVQPEKIVARVQAQLRTATRTGANWSATVTARVRNWADGVDARPVNAGGLPEQRERHEQEIHLEPGAGVFIENPLGNVKITGSEEGPALIAFEKAVWGPVAEQLKTAFDSVEVNIYATDSKLDIKVSAPDQFREGTVDLEIRVPKTVTTRVSTHFGELTMSGLEGRAEAVTSTGALRLSDLSGDARGETAAGNISLERIAGAATVATQSGDIQATQIGRGLSANTASGDVVASDLEGGRIECKSVSGEVTVERVGIQTPLDVTVESVSGNVKLTNATGNIALKAVSGDVETEELTATRLQAQTVSGDVQVRLRTTFSGMMQINTVSGDVHLALPADSNARVSLGTASGDLRCDLDAHNVVATDTLWTGQLGAGAGTINVQTISGDSHILQA